MVTIAAPPCEMREGLRPKDRRRGPSWICKACGFNSMFWPGGKRFSKRRPDCPCGAIDMAPAAPEDLREQEGGDNA